MMSTFFKTNNYHIIFSISYEILKHDSWVLCLTDYTEHSKSKNSRLRAIKLVQCPRFTVVQIIGNFDFFLNLKIKSRPQSPPSPLVKNQAHRYKNPFFSILTMQVESLHVEDQPGIRNPTTQHRLNFCLCKFSSWCQETKVVAMWG